MLQLREEQLSEEYHLPTIWWDLQRAIGWENLFTWFCGTSRQEEFCPANLKRHLICLSFPSLAGKCDWIFNFPRAQLPEITCAAFQPWGCPSNPVPCSLRLQPSSGCVALWIGQAEAIPGPCWPHPSPLWPQDSWVGPRGAPDWTALSVVVVFFWLFWKMLACHLLYPWKVRVSLGRSDECLKADCGLLLWRRFCFYTIEWK